LDAIVVNDLRKRYGEVQALDGVSFAVREGEVFGLLGPNGAGKSTTVRTLVTLTAPDSGSASVAGHDVAREQAAVRRLIGYVPQDSGVDELGTGRENLTLQGHVQGMGGRELRARTNELLELVGITDAANRIVKTYSGGMRRRLDIALGLVHRPRVLFLDEPTRGIDVGAKAEVYGLIRSLAANGVAVLFISSELPEILGISDRILVMREGRITGELPAEGATEEQVLRLALSEAA
jgi:ABC-2 type transport system ATP-binding protein